jgi:hypothetical protein
MKEHFTPLMTLSGFEVTWRLDRVCLESQGHSRKFVRIVVSALVDRFSSFTNILRELLNSMILSLSPEKWRISHTKVKEVHIFCYKIIVSLYKTSSLMLHLKFGLLIY